MIKISQLSVAFAQKNVLKDISISFPTKNVHGIVGLNGAGKTTFFNTVSGIIKPKTGSILYNNQPPKRQQIGYLETENFFYSGITGREYLGIFPNANANFNIERWQQIFSLPLDELVVNYSTGMKKKIALLSMMKQDKAILILDEPFNGMDMESCKMLEKVIVALRDKEKTIFISSHILESLFGCCDYIHYLKNGSIQKSYDRASFAAINKDVFHQLEEDTHQLLKTAI